MKLISNKSSLLLNVLILMLIIFLTSCNTKSYNSNQQENKIGFSGFYLDMDYMKVKSTMDSLLNLGELHYFEAKDIVGNIQKNLYSDFSGISSSLCAKVNLRGSYIIDERLTSIQLTLCSRSNKENQGFSFNCDMNEIKKLFDLYKEKFGKPTLVGQGEAYDWLSKRISNVYYPGPKGRWIMDKMYFWERGNYIIYFDFGYPAGPTNSDIQVTKSSGSEFHDSTSAPIIYYDFTTEYMDKLLEKASRIK